MTHDRYFLDNVATWILEIDKGNMWFAILFLLIFLFTTMLHQTGRCIPFKGNYTSWLASKADRVQIEESKNQTTAKFLQKELEWIRTAPKARQSKSKVIICR